MGIKKCPYGGGPEKTQVTRTHEIHNEDCLFFSEATVEVSQHTHDACSLDFHGTAAVWWSDLAGVGEGVELRQPG